MLFRCFFFTLLVCFGLAPGSARADAPFSQPSLRRLLVMAQAGNAEAQYHVGMFYNNGMAGSPRDPKAAFAWFLKSAAGGDALGAYKAGCYYAGQFPGVVAVDLHKALAHKLVAASAGYSLAQFDVGRAYLERRDFAVARRWLEKSADQGEARAMGLLWWMHENTRDEGAAADPAGAYRYLKLFERITGHAGNAEFQADFGRTSALMPPQEREKLDADVLNWVAQPSLLTLQAKDAGGAITHLLEGK